MIKLKLITDGKDWAIKRIDVTWFHNKSAYFFLAKQEYSDIDGVSYIIKWADRPNSYCWMDEQTAKKWFRGLQE